MRARSEPNLGSSLAILVVLTAIGLVGTGQPSLAQEDPAADIQQSVRFELPDDPNEVVISMTEHIPQIFLPSYPSLRIYADGRVVRHRPEGMTDAGDHESRISTDELQGLVETLADRGVLDLDKAATLERRRTADRTNGTLHYASDPSTIEIEIRLASYRAAPGAAVTSDFRQTVAWTGLRQDARVYTGISEIQGLATTFRDLEQLAARVERDSRAGGGS